MSQRHSEYARIPGDTYVTPRWCYDALFAVEEVSAPWDCAPVNADFDFLSLMCCVDADAQRREGFKQVPQSV
jgi:hypothetical protein